MLQYPFNIQNYDRFGYVYNNPLLYVDLDGNEISLGVAVVIGVAVAITTKVIANLISGIPIWYGLGKSAFMGAVSGAISFGIGSAATSAYISEVEAYSWEFKMGNDNAFFGINRNIYELRDTFKIVYKPKDIY